MNKRAQPYRRRARGCAYGPDKDFTGPCRGTCMAACHARASVGTKPSVRLPSRRRLRHSRAHERHGEASPPHLCALRRRVRMRQPRIGACWCAEEGFRLPMPPADSGGGLPVSGVPETGGCYAATTSRRKRAMSPAISAAGRGGLTRVALHLGAAGAAHQLELLLGLDPLGRGLDAEACPEIGDRPDDHRAAAVALDVLDERAVDLDLVERERAQIAERGISGAEIVHRDAHAERAQLMQHGDDRLVVLQQHRLGDLQLQPVRRKSRRGERLRHGRDQSAVAELHRREVHRDLDRVRPARRLRCRPRAAPIRRAARSGPSPRRAG